MGKLSGELLRKKCKIFYILYAKDQEEVLRETKIPDFMGNL